MALTLLPTVALAAESTGASVGQIGLSAGDYTTNGSTKTTTKPTDNYAYFDMVSGVATLTLHNFTYSGSGYVCGQNDLTIVLEGENHITSTGTDSYCVYSSQGALTIQGDGSLSATKDTATVDSNAYYGIYGNTSVTINGSATVTAIGGQAGSTGGYSYGISSGGAITIGDSASVSATANSAAGSCGIHGAGNVTINGSATVTTTGGTAVYGSYGISSGGAITIGGSAKVTATGGAATGNNGTSYGICGGTSVTISDSAKVTATGGTATGNNGTSYGIYGGNNGVAISGGTVTAKSTSTTGTKAAFNTAPTLTSYTNYQWNTNESTSWTLKQDDGTAYTYDANHTYVAIKPFFTYTMNFTGTSAWAWAGNKNPSTEDFSGDGWSWKYDSDSTKEGNQPKLTLSGLDFTTTAQEAVKLPNGAIIELADGTTNTVTIGDAQGRLHADRRCRKPLHRCGCNGSQQRG